MSLLASNYRLYQLPWAGDGPQERRFKRALIAGFIFWVMLVVVSQLWPTPVQVTPPVLSPEVVKLVLPPPPPPKPPKPPEKTEVPPEPELKPVPKPQNTDQARKQAQSALSAVKDQLADLRANLKPEKLASAKPLDSKVDGPARADRSVITSNVAGGASGINTAAMSAGFGGGSGSLHGHATMQGGGSFGDGLKGGGANRSGASGKAARSREEIEIMFDRNKSAIYSLYSRALRDNPALQGKVVVQLTIAPNGEVTDCHILSSELKNEELEKKLVTRIKLFHFEAKDVETMTTSKPLDFLPG
jgi:TonB family protein